MKKRQIIILLIAAAILVGGKLGMNALAKPEERKAKKSTISIATVFTEVVKNDSIPLYVESTGELEAVKRIELFSEVQGIMEADDGRFKAGNTFKKGEVLMAIRSNDQQAQLYAQRSAFESSLTAILPDLKADYSEDFPIWEKYVRTLSIKKSTQELPEVKSDKLNSFLVGRGIYSGFHTLKNLEIVNEKYRLIAPYYGMLIAANVNPGTVIRPGQALGVFIQPTHYELETSIDALTTERLSVGQEVELKMQGLADKQWVGKISRLVKAIDKNSQMSTYFVAVDGDDLKEGMFLQAKVKANDVPNAYKIPRAALVDNDQVYLVKNEELVLKKITNEYFDQNTVIVSGLEDGEEVLTKVPPSAFEGMKVTVYKEN